MDVHPITKAEALSAYDNNQAALGRALGLTRQAVSAMPDGPLHEHYVLKLRYVLKPEVFGLDRPAAQAPLGAQRSAEPRAAAGAR